MGENKKRAKRKDPIEMAVQWLKERGINPHISERDIIKMGLFEAMASGCSFETLTGYVKIPDPETVQRLQDTDYFKGTIEHEFFHRADYLDKFGGNKKLRREVYRKWTAGEKILREIMKHERYLDEKHPFYQAVNELESEGYDVINSLVRLWYASPENFKKALKIATALRAAEIRSKNKIAVPGITTAKNKHIQIAKIHKAKENLKKYFTMMRVKAKNSRKYFELLSEVPAHMIWKYVQGASPEEGLYIAKERLASTDYFGGTEMESTAKKTANMYLFLARVLRKAGCSDEEVLRGVLNLHKNIYTPEDVEMFVNMERKGKMVSTAARAVRSWVGTEDIREGIAAQALGRMEKNLCAYRKLLKK